MHVEREAWEEIKLYGRERSDICEIYSMLQIQRKRFISVISV